MSFHAIISGTKKYIVTAEFDSDGGFSKGTCTCPAYDEYWGCCKHIIAVLYEIKDRDGKGEYASIKSNEIAKNILDYFRYKQTDVKTPVQLEITYEFEPNQYTSIENASFISLRIGENKLYVVKSIKKLLESIESKQELQFGKGFTFDPKIHNFKETDQPIINLLQEIYEAEKILNENSYGFGKTSLFKGKKANLTSRTTRRFFDIVKDRSFNTIIMNRQHENVKILEEDIPLKFTLDKQENDLVLSVDYETPLIPLVIDGEYFFKKDTIYRTSEQQREYFVPFYSAIVKQRHNSIKIPQKFKDSFVSEVYPFIEKNRRY